MREGESLIGAREGLSGRDGEPPDKEKAEAEHVRKWAETRRSLRGPSPQSASEACERGYESVDDGRGGVGVGALAEAADLRRASRSAHRLHEEAVLGAEPLLERRGVVSGELNRAQPAAH